MEIMQASYSRSELERLLFGHGLDTRFSALGKAAALGQVFYPIGRGEVDAAEIEHAQELLEEVAQDLNSRIERPQFNDPTDLLSQRLTALEAALASDGLDLINGRLSPLVSPAAAVGPLQGRLEHRLRDLGFSVASTHLEQLLDNAARSNWEAANSQVRSFLEGLCEEIAAVIHRGPDPPPTRGEARQFLQESDFLDSDEGDLLKSLMKILHAAGGHAGVAAEDDAHRRRIMAVALANHYMDRLDDWLAAPEVGPGVRGG